MDIHNFASRGNVSGVPGPQMIKVASFDLFDVEDRELPHDTELDLNLLTVPIGSRLRDRHEKDRSR